MFEIKMTYNTIYQRCYYWEDKNGYRISVVKNVDSNLTDEEVKAILRERIKEYKDK